MGSSSAVNETELVTQAQRGNRNAFGELLHPRSGRDECDLPSVCGEIPPPGGQRDKKFVGLAAPFILPSTDIASQLVIPYCRQRRDRYLRRKNESCPMPSKICH